MNQEVKEAIKQERLHWVMFCMERASKHAQSDFLFGSILSTECLLISNAILAAMKEDQEKEDG